MQPVDDPVAFTRPRGFTDRGAPAARQVRNIQARLAAVFEGYGYAPVHVPTLEYIDLYHRERIGDAMFHGLILARLSDAAEFPVRGAACGDDGPSPQAEALHEVALRPEFTAPVARMVVGALAHPDAPPALPLRLHYGGRVFRELGVGPLQLREFTQVGVELVGGPGGPADLEALLLACDGAEALGLTDWWLRIGHAGLCRAILEAEGVPDSAQASVAAGLERAARLRTKAAGETAAWARYAALRGPEIRRRSSAEDRIAFPALSALDQADPATLADQLPRAHAAWLRRAWCGPLGLTGQQAERLLDLADQTGDPADVIPALHRFASTGPARAALDELEMLCDQLRSLRPGRLVVSATASRGIAYYTGVSFELHTNAAGAALSDVAGGGRYDSLHRWIQRRSAATARLRGHSPPDDGPGGDGVPGPVLGGVGLAFGVERVAAALPMPDLQLSMALVSPSRIDQLPDTLALADKIRALGLAATVAFAPPADPVAYARARDARWVVVLGDVGVTVRDLNTGAEIACTVADALAQLRVVAGAQP